METFKIFLVYITQTFLYVIIININHDTKNKDEMEMEWKKMKSVLNIYI